MRETKKIACLMKDAQNKFGWKWITSTQFCDIQPQKVYHRQLDNASLPVHNPELENSHILFRRKFTLNASSNTVVCLTADDYYKLYINGVFVTQGPAAGYPFHYFYNEVDISDYVHPGVNLIAAHTYYQGLINRVWVSGDCRHGLLLNLCSGEKTILHSDESFLCHKHSGFSAVGIAGYATQFMERYDANSPEVGFERLDFDDSTWLPAKISRHADYRLFPQPSRQLEFEAIAPVSIINNGCCCFIDFGKVFVGNLEFHASGHCGDEIAMRFGQELNEDGSVRYKLRANCEYVEYFRLSGRIDILNQFDYKSFRYVELQLPSGCEVEKGTIALRARHYPFALKASCNRNDEKSLKIWDLCVGTLRYGVQEVIQDCMEREKGYYMGDGCYSLLTFSLLTKDYSLMEKFFDDFLRTSFVNRGLMTCAACSFMQEIAEFPLIMFTLLLEYCHLKGDLDFVRARYSAFADILDFYREEYAEADGLLNNLDKWCVVEWPPNLRDGYDVDLSEGQVCAVKHNVINAYYIGAIKCLNKVAGLIGETPYKTCDEAALLEKAFVSAFYDNEKKLFRDSLVSTHVSMPGNVIAWWFELFPNSEGTEKLKTMIREKRLSQSMFFVTFPMFCSLVRAGEDELMHDLLTDEKAWLNMIAEGATRTFEGWGKESKWNTSLFHLTMSYGAAFLTDWNISEIFRFPRS